MVKIANDVKFQKIRLNDRSNYNSRYRPITFLAILGLMILFGIIVYQNSEVLAIEEETSSNNNYSFSEIFKKVNQSVVQVSTTTDPNPNQLGVKLGSGFIYDQDGHIITNYHVVNGGNEFLVTFPDGSIYSCELVGFDPYSDLAVIKVIVPQEKLIPLTIGNSKNLVIGQHVAAVGNPFGLSGSMTEGIISGLGRQLPSLPTESLPPLFGGNEITLRSSSFSIPDIIQTDAAINPGNSGGPLLNIKGEVIGINSAIFSNTGEYAGVGFAIPSNTIQKIVPSLIEIGSYDHPWLGIIGVDITPTIAEAIDLNLTDSKGFLITDVNANSPADKAGIQGGDRIANIDANREIDLGGDILIGIDGNPVRKIDDLLTYLEREKRVGEKVTVDLIRNGETLEKTLTLEKRPNSEDIFQIGNQQLSLGVTGIEVNPLLAEALNLTDSKGFLVTSVRANGPADKAGIQGGYKVEIINNIPYTVGGDIIIGIDNKTINTVQDIKNYINSKKEGDVVNLKVIQDGEIKNIDAKLEVLPITSSNAKPFNKFNPFGEDREEDS